MSSSYAYPPLLGSEIRLIYLPNDPSERRVSQVIICDIRSFLLEQAPPFLAVSYVWNDETCLLEAPSHPLMLADGHEIQLTHSLWRVLFTLRQWRLSASRNDAFANEVEHFFGGPIPDYVWADAICIDQTNCTEKEHQIPRMTDIYRSACVVYGFLGMPSSEADTRWIGQLSDNCDELVAEFHCRGEKSMASERDFSLKEFFKDDLAFMIDVFHYVISSPWFSRVWIVQELAAARDWPVLGLGKVLIKSQSLAFLASLLDSRYLEICPTEFDSESVLRFRTMCTFRRWQTWTPRKKRSKRCSQMVLSAGGKVYVGEKESSTQESSRPLEEIVAPMSVMYQWRSGRGEKTLASRLSVALLLSSRAMMQATQPHDIIYGILGLTTPRTLPDCLRPDYGADYPQVCHSYARFIVKHTGCLWILGYTRQSRFRGFDLSKINVPSWVPDFRSMTFYDQTFESNSRKPSSRKSVSFSSDGLILRVRGSNLAFGPIVSIWRGRSSVRDWAEPRHVKGNVFCKFHTDFLRASARCLAIPIGEATDVWLRGHARAHHAPGASKHDEGAIHRAAAEIRVVWDALLEAKEDITITWHMDEILGHTLAAETSEVIFKIASQMTTRKSALTEDGTIWSILSEADDNLVKVGDIPTVVEGYSYSNDTVHEMAVVLRPRGRLSEHVGIVEGNRRKTSCPGTNWPVINIA